MVNLIQKQPVKYFDQFSCLPQNAFILEVKENYGMLKVKDRAVFVPIAVHQSSFQKSPQNGAIILVNDRVGLFQETVLGCQLNNLDDNSPIYSWRNRNNFNYQIKGLFLGILRSLN